VQTGEVKRVKRAMWRRSEGKISKASIFLVEAWYNGYRIQVSVIKMNDLGDTLFTPQCTASKHHHISLLL
jgi:hypothetical protein